MRIDDHRESCWNEEKKMNIQSDRYSNIKKKHTHNWTNEIFVECMGECFFLISFRRVNPEIKIEYSLTWSDFPEWKSMINN